MSGIKNSIGSATKRFIGDAPNGMAEYGCKDSFPPWYETAVANELYSMPMSGISVPECCCPASAERLVIQHKSKWGWLLNPLATALPVFP